MHCIRSPMFSILVNGEIVGFFPGGKGLRQGDPVLLKRKTREGTGFNYHKGCKEINLNHLCFADDMFIFSKGDIQSIQIVNDTLKTFAEVSGLNPNHQKSIIFFNGVSATQKIEILRIIGFQEGSLPVKYLGLPLISTRLSKEHCSGLIQRITGRVNSWSAKCLSYAGRLQLINSVLLSMQMWKAFAEISYGIKIILIGRRRFPME
ncbi:uncharacterized protein LOC126677161 [Mercurialis annua]|uniref:uncharacterized protein LOC126677161 n=1 Tax=Mercurialis annua TaxID=3986 RepID=UPI00215FF27F|nr:uncharacterized protein LOC126677161 [Mercurialis annua]